MLARAAVSPRVAPCNHDRVERVRPAQIANGRDQSRCNDGRPQPAGACQRSAFVSRRASNGTTTPALPEATAPRLDRPREPTSARAEHREHPTGALHGPAFDGDAHVRRRSLARVDGHGRFGHDHSIALRGNRPRRTRGARSLHSSSTFRSDSSRQPTAGRRDRRSYDTPPGIVVERCRGTSTLGRVDRARRTSRSHIEIVPNLADREPGRQQPQHPARQHRGGTAR
jgi:hypothetical protein